MSRGGSADEEGDAGGGVADAGLEEAVVVAGEGEDRRRGHLDAAVGGVVVDLRVLPPADLVARAVGALAVPGGGLGVDEQLLAQGPVGTPLVGEPEGAAVDQVPGVVVVLPQRVAPVREPAVPL